MNLGFPPEGQQAVSAFWASFWPSFWSGLAYSLIYSVVTGVLVGWLLNRSQRKSDERALAASHEREFSSSIDELRTALANNDVVHIDSAASAIPISVSSSAKILRPLPLTLWRGTLPKHAAAIDAAIQVQKQFLHYNILAAKTDQAIEQKVRLLHHQKGYGAHLDAAMSMFCVAKLLGFASEAVWPWVIKLPISGQLDAYEEMWSEICADGALMANSAPLIQARETAKNSAAKLLAALDAPL